MPGGCGTGDWTEGGLQIIFYGVNLTTCGRDDTNGSVELQ